MHPVEKVNDCSVFDLLAVVLDLDGFSVSGCSGADLFVGRSQGGSSDVADTGLHELAESLFEGSSEPELLQDGLHRIQVTDRYT